MCIGFELTQILECVTINLTLVYALHAYSGIKNKNPETLLVILSPIEPCYLKSVLILQMMHVQFHFIIIIVQLQTPDHDRPDKNWSVRGTLTAYFIAWYV